LIKVTVVEDHPIVQAGLSWILTGIPGVELSAAVARIEDLGRLAQHPDVVLLGVAVPVPRHGYRAVQSLTALGHRIVVVNADEEGIGYAAEMFRVGALGYLGKRAATTDYAAAIQAAAAGRAYVGACAAAARCDAHRPSHDHPTRLTGREADVAGLLVHGYTNAEIAGMLGIRERTVDGHLENIRQKVCESRRVRVAMRLKDLGYPPPAAHRR
jgi:two-component system invasion response regulator UvrY